VRLAQDTWTPSDALTVNVGVRWEGEWQFAGDGQLSIAMPHEWSPRLGVLVDPTSLGRMKIGGSFARYHQSIPLDIAQRSGTGDPTILSYSPSDVCGPTTPEGRKACDAPDNKSVLNGSDQPDQQSHVIGAGRTAVDPNLQPPSSDDLTVDAEGAVFANVHVGAVYTRRWIGCPFDGAMNVAAALAASVTSSCAQCPVPCTVGRSLPYFAKYEPVSTKGARDGTTWLVDLGARRAVGQQFAFSSAAAGVPAATALRSLTLHVLTVGARRFLDGTSSTGAGMFFWDSRWRPRSTAAVPGTLRDAHTDETAISRLLIGASRTVHVAVRGEPTASSLSSTLTTDAAALTITYRLDGATPWSSRSSLCCSSSSSHPWQPLRPRRRLLAPRGPPPRRRARQRAPPTHHRQRRRRRRPS